MAGTVLRSKLCSKSDGIKLSQLHFLSRGIAVVCFAHFLRYFSVGFTQTVPLSQMAWVGAMNNIRDRVDEIVLNEVIFV